MQLRDREFTAGHDTVTVRVTVDGEGRAALTVAVPAAPAAVATTPLADLAVDAEGPGWAGTRVTRSTVGERLRAETVETIPGDALVVVQCDHVTGLRVRTTATPIPGAAAVRVQTLVTNVGEIPRLLRGVSSLVHAGFGLARDELDEVDLVTGRNDWLGENRWQVQPLREAGLADLYRGVVPREGRRLRGAIRASSSSTWSTAEQLPVAALVHAPSGRSWMWQVEHNGPWSWQVGESEDGLYLAASGPDDLEHQWSHRLEPGGSFTAVPVTLAVSTAGLEGVAGEMTRARRASRTSRDPQVPVIFNDYMNTVMGDPDAATLHPLVDAAASTGADVFVVDAGWYADDGDWWDAVGEWQPATTRFPGGIEALTAHIRARGMTPGLWLEPEVVGLRSPIADKLPAEAFLLRDGARVVEDGRYHLDFSHPAARGHLDEVVDRLVDDYGVGYLKLDYNIRGGAGTDHEATSLGDGLLRHQRAYLDWIDAVRSRHPRLLLENCASGAMRQDWAQLQRHDLQSTSDQEDAGLYPPIAAAAALSLLPEQAASWAYPQPTMTAEQIVFTLVTGLAGRLYLSGWVDRMTDGQLDLVRDAVACHRARHALLTRGTPCWPLGLPGWDDGWIVSGLVDEVGGVCSLNVWRRDAAADSARLRLPALSGDRRWTAVTQSFPGLPLQGVDSGWTFTIDPDGTWLDVGCTDDVVSARVVMVTAGA